MINRMIKYSLDNRQLIIFLSVILLVGGIYTATRVEIDVFPDLTAPTVAILTDAHGMAAEEVEKLVSFPIESAMNGATDVRRVRSTSSFGMSIVWVEFDWGTDIYKARQIVSEKLSIIGTQLPENVESPVLAPQTSIMGEIMLISVTSDSLSMFELRTIAERQIKQQLLSVTGVSQVVIIGGLPKQYQILADPFKMQYFDVSLDELLTASEHTNSNASGGFINEHGQEYIIRATARSTDTALIGNSVVKVKDGKPIKISDVARVTVGHSPIIGEAFLDEKPAVIMTVLKQPNTNTLTLSEDIDEAMEQLSTFLPENIHLNSHIFRQADFIDTAVNNVLRVLLEGGIFVSIVLFLFLLNLRTTVISLTAIPLSLLLSLITLQLLGLTLNTMSLGGMAIAIGVLVDDAIIDVENVLKRLKQNHRRPPKERENPLAVIYRASVEIRSSIVQATLIIIVAFIPLFFLSGMEGRMLVPLGLTFIVSLFASLLVAITLTPVMSSYLLVTDKQLKADDRGRNKVVQKLNGLYAASLASVIRYRKAIIGISIILLVGAIIIFSGFGRSFLPEFNEGTLTITTVSQPGISIDESNRITSKIDEELMQIPEVKYVSRRTGRAELNEHSHGGSNSSEIDVPYVLDERSKDEFMEEVRDRLSGIPGISINIGQPLGHRIDHMLSGTRANIAIKVFGTDLTTMYNLANEIKGRIEGIDGLVDLNVEQLVEIPQIQIRPRREMLARYGIPMNRFVEYVETAIAGKKVSEVYENNLNFPLVLRYKEVFRDDIDAIRNAYIDTYRGEKIPLSFVADVVSFSGPNTINRENVQRKLVISANVSGRDVGSVVDEVRETIDQDVTLPENYFIRYGGQFESASKASRLLLFTSILAIIIIYVILYQEFKSATLAGLVLINLPLAVIGGVLAIWFTSDMLSIPAIIGFITLFGIATRNGILLVSRFQNLAKEQQFSLVEIIQRGSSDRLNPILMTALASGLALIPLALSGGKPGNEIQSPMAIVILGGLFTSTLLNLFVIPAVYYIIQKKNDHETKK
ncbi:MAG TPA: efflux RND transporter permease subunit [Bacteroidales bacterium]|nr:efflux RND transporter permease subunit [Bacteroidales bacterium]HPE56659.1 efflux RND transporter permease subunit [Bacteroidales bacterium]HRX97202.1 efflux RND transporter permease subunit [Bacteroidales bacterium]